jgi:hypothetical protein
VWQVSHTQAIAAFPIAFVIRGTAAAKQSTIRDIAPIQRLPNLSSRTL